jgi:hypothetical protein
MANEEHVALLRQGVKIWNTWREANPHVSPNLHDAVPRGSNLIRVDPFRAALSNTEPLQPAPRPVRQPIDTILNMMLR